MDQTEINDQIVSVAKFTFDRLCAQLVLTSTRKRFRRKARKQLRIIRNTNKRWRELRTEIAKGIDVSKEARQLIEQQEQASKEKQEIYAKYRAKILRYSRLVKGLQLLADTASVQVFGKPKPLLQIPKEYEALTKAKKQKRK